MEPFRSLLQAAATLDRCAAGDGCDRDGQHSTVRSTRVLVKLIEGWCVDQAVRRGHAALSGIPKDQRDDAAVLSALRRYVGSAD